MAVLFGATDKIDVVTQHLHKLPRRNSALRNMTRSTPPDYCLGEVART